jgi:hypothetical protein
MLKTIAFVLTICLAACGGGGGTGDAAIEPSINKQVAPPPAPATTARSVYGDLDPSYTANITWSDLIALPNIYDFTYDGIPLRTLIDGGPIGRYERGSLALLLTTDPSPTILLSVGHLEAVNPGTPLNAFKDNLREAVGIVRAAGKLPEIRGLHHVTGFEQPATARIAQFDKAAQDVARDLGVRFYDVASLPWSPADLEADGLHPTLAYSNRIGEYLRTQMQ